MSALAVITYAREETAAKAAAALGCMQPDYLIRLEDLAWVIKQQSGKLKLHLGTSLAGPIATGGAFLGFLFGLIFLVPLFGMAVGASTRAPEGKLSDYGIDAKWIQEIVSGIPAGGSALFVVVAHNANAERVLPETVKFGGSVVTISLGIERKRALQEAQTHIAQ